MHPAHDRTVARTAALTVAVLGLLPLANWISGGHSAEWYGLVLGEWLSGTAIVVGAATVLTILSRRIPLLWQAGLIQRLVTPGRARWILWIAAGVAFAGYAVVAWGLFDARPLHIDEIMQVFQGRIFAAGRLWLPSDPHPEFTSVMHLIDAGGKVYSHFPPGGPAMLALGSWAGVEWLIGPVFGAISVLLFGRLMRLMNRSAASAAGATLVFALAPFVAFMSGSHMNHVTSLTWILLGVVALVQSLSRDRGGLPSGVIAGFGFGMAATIRPVDGLAFALPAAAWYLWRAIRHRHVVPMLGAGIGISLPLIGLLWFNAQTTGDPLTFGYELLWGESQALGFHAAPWGEPHTPIRGLELLNLYFLRLQTYTFELPIPSLLPAIIALGLTGGLSAPDRYLLSAGALLAGIYFAYWFDGFYLGPRFMYPLMPVIALWTARLPGAVRDRLGEGKIWRATVYALITAVLVGGFTSLPIRADQYRRGLRSSRWDADRAARQAGVRDALIFVRESWGSELMARMWALGISRTDAESIYQKTDACQLELALGELEARAVSPTGATEALRAIPADTSRLVSTADLTGDPSIRLTRGSVLPEFCGRKVVANRGGYTSLTPLRLARGNGNVYVRDLGQRNLRLLDQYPARPVYLLKPLDGTPGADLVFLPQNRDSLKTAWSGTP
jgi:hypothetical protein